LVPGENLRHATLEEHLSQEQLLAELRDSITQLSEEKKPFAFDDHRSQKDKATPDTDAPETAVTTRRNAAGHIRQRVEQKRAIGEGRRCERDCKTKPSS
jgi:hypothetical protein